jgi:Zn-dependent metalloprotease
MFHFSKMKKYFSLVLFLFALNFAKSQYCNVHNSSEIISPSKEKAAAFLTRFFKEKLTGSELYLTSEKSSLAAHHFAFDQKIDDISIAHSFVKISVANNGKIVSIYEQLVNVSEFQKLDYKPILLADFDMQNLKIESSEKVWWISHQLLEPALEVTIENNEHKKARMVYTQRGLVDETSLSFHFMQDSLVSGKVFYPDPLTSSGNVYGGNYRDFGDSDTSALNNERVTKTFKVEFDSPVFKLQNPSLELQDLDNDGTPIATSTSPNFDFTRGQKGFEDVNAFYHISIMQQRLVDLGFSISMYPR